MKRRCVLLCVLYVACLPKKEDEESSGPIGSALVNLVDANGTAPTGTFIGERISSRTLRRCEDGDTIVSKDVCFSEHVISAESEGRSLVIRNRLGGPPPENRVRVQDGAGLTFGGNNEVNLFTPGASFPWSTANAAQIGKVMMAVAPDGKVTYRFERVVVTGREKTSSGHARR